MKETDKNAIKLHITLLWARQEHSNMRYPAPTLNPGVLSWNVQYGLLITILTFGLKL